MKEIKMIKVGKSSVLKVKPQLKEKFKEVFQNSG